MVILFSVNFAKYKYAKQVTYWLVSVRENGKMVKLYHHIDFWGKNDYLHWRRQVSFYITDMYVVYLYVSHSHLSRQIKILKRKSKCFISSRPQKICSTRILHTSLQHTYCPIWFHSRNWCSRSRALFVRFSSCTQKLLALCCNNNANDGYTCCTRATLAV